MKESSPDYIDLIVQSAKDTARLKEQERVIEIIEKETRHYGKTHYAGVNCMACRIYETILGDPGEA